MLNGIAYRHDIDMPLQIAVGHGDSISRRISLRPSIFDRMPPIKFSGYARYFIMARQGLACLHSMQSFAGKLQFGIDRIHSHADAIQFALADFAMSRFVRQLRIPFPCPLPLIPQLCDAQPQQEAERLGDDESWVPEAFQSDWLPARHRASCMVELGKDTLGEVGSARRKTMALSAQADESGSL